MERLIATPYGYEPFGYAPSSRASGSPTALRPAASGSSGWTGSRTAATGESLGEVDDIYAPELSLPSRNIAIALFAGIFAFAAWLLLLAH